MAGMSIGGIASGLDTASIIDQLISIERNSQVLLRQKLTQQNKVVSAYQGVNARAGSLAAAATALAKPEAWTRVTATSSSSSVSVSSTSATGSGTLTFDVVNPATKASFTTGVIPNGANAGAKTFTLTSSTGASRTLTATSGDAGDLAKAVNDAAFGVTATTVRDSDGKFRLLLTAQNTGAAGEFTVSGAVPPLTRLSDGRDAVLDLGNGVVVSSASNTFSDLMAGVSVTVSKAEAGVTVTAAPDTAAVAKQVGGLVGSMGVLLSEIADQSRSVVGAAGVLAGDSTLRLLQQRVLGTMSTAVPGATLKDVGIELGRDGTVSFSESAFTAYVAKEPDKAKALIGAFSTAVADTAKGASDPSTGTLSLAVKDGQTTARDLTSRIEAWDVRLDLRRQTLERQYASLELALSKSRSTGSWLTSALAGLPTSSR